jgi:hypothetical protein
MAAQSGIQLCGAATVFVVKDVLRSVEHYRDVLGFHTEFTYGEPTFYAGNGMRDFNLHDLDGNELCFGMESRR